MQEYTWNHPHPYEWLCAGSRNNIRLFADARWMTDRKQSVIPHLLKVNAIPHLQGELLAFAPVDSNTNPSYTCATDLHAPIYPELALNHMEAGHSFITTNLIMQDIDKRLYLLIEQLAASLWKSPRGHDKISKNDQHHLMEQGAHYLMEKKGLFSGDDKEFVYHGGYFPLKGYSSLHPQALNQAFSEFGHLANRKDYVQVQIVDKVYDTERARFFGMFKNQIMFNVVSGPGALTQALHDWVEEIGAPFRQPDGWIAFPPASKEAKLFLTNYYTVINIATAHRQMLRHKIHILFNDVIKDVESNILFDTPFASIEEHTLPHLSPKPLRVYHHYTHALSCSMRQNASTVEYPTAIIASPLCGSYVLSHTPSSKHGALPVLCSGQGVIPARQNPIAHEATPDLTIKIKAKDPFTLSQQDPFEALDPLCNGLTSIRSINRITHTSPLCIITY